jgi:hypothetical protein
VGLLPLLDVVVIEQEQPYRHVGEDVLHRPALDHHHDARRVHRVLYSSNEVIYRRLPVSPATVGHRVLVRPFCPD